MEKFSSRLQEYGIQIYMDKSNAVNLSGFIVKQGQITMEENKITAVRD